MGNARKRRNDENKEKTKKRKTGRFGTKQSARSQNARMENSDLNDSNVVDEVIQEENKAPDNEQDIVELRANENLDDEFNEDVKVQINSESVEFQDGEMGRTKMQVSATDYLSEGEMTEDSSSEIEVETVTETSDPEVVDGPMSSNNNASRIGYRKVKDKLKNDGEEQIAEQNIKQNDMQLLKEIVVSEGDFICRLLSCCNFLP